MKQYEWFTTEDGTCHYRKKNLKKLFNCNYLDYTNKTQLIDVIELPELICTTEVFPDYLALYSERGRYQLTPNTGVCFFQYDDIIDGQRGLANSIYYKNQRDLEKYKDRFKGVKFFIGPDYSLLGDLDLIENLYRIKRARIVSIWLSLELKAIVIPLITFPNIEFVRYVLKGLEKCTVVAFSTKGFVNDKIERRVLKEAIRITVDSLSLKAIVIYDVCGDNYEVMEIFRYAADKGIKLIIPCNTLKERNALRKAGGEHA